MLGVFEFKGLKVSIAFRGDVFLINGITSKHPAFLSSFVNPFQLLPGGRLHQAAVNQGYFLFTQVATFSHSLSLGLSKSIPSLPGLWLGNYLVYLCK